MKILFINADIFLSEPLGIMTLSAICRKNGHITKLISVKRHSVVKEIKEFDPDIVAYSAMSAGISLLRGADRIIKEWMENEKKYVYRIMGGPHPTYFPEVLNEMGLDAVCIGEGDMAMPLVIDAYAENRGVDNIPNILYRGANIDEIKKELIQDLDQIPFMDREIYYDAVPAYRMVKMRSVLTSRGCPYRCTYCHNHAFNKMFKGCGKIVRRASIDRVIEEIRYTVDDFPPVELIRFGDDTFAHVIDEWLIEFLKKYKKEINLPFYCLMRSNTLSEDMAKLLSAHGCVSIGMSVESGIEEIRNDILKRNLTDDIVQKSFSYAEKYGIKTYGNTILAIPGGTIQDDINSLLFTRNLKLTAPTFSILVPYPRTELYDMAIANGMLSRNYDFDSYCSEQSALDNYTSKEKDVQLNMVSLGTLFCYMPDKLLPILNFLIERIKPNRIFKFIGNAFLIYKTGKYIFPNIIPKNPFILMKFFFESIRFQIPKKELLDSVKSSNT